MRNFVARRESSNGSYNMYSIRSLGWQWTWKSDFINDIKIVVRHYRKHAYIKDDFRRPSEWVSERMSEWVSETERTTRDRYSTLVRHGHSILSLLLMGNDFEILLSKAAKNTHKCNNGIGDSYHKLELLTTKMWTSYERWRAHQNELTLFGVCAAAASARSDMTTGQIDDAAQEHTNTVRERHYGQSYRVFCTVDVHKINMRSTWRRDSSTSTLSTTDDVSFREFCECERTFTNGFGRNP